jgi:hypothetical protein
MQNDCRNVSSSKGFKVPLTTAVCTERKEELREKADITR